MLKQFSVAALALFCTGCLGAQTGRDSTAAPKTVLEIISNRAIWGNDFPLALAYMESVAQTGDKTLELTPTALARPQRFVNAQAANPQVGRLNTALQNADQKDSYQKVRRNFSFQTRPPTTDLVKAAGSDSVLVGLNFGKVQFFKPNVNMITIQKELGQAEQVSYQTINGQGEGLPQILTFHSYAGGAIVFVESNYSRQPRLLERVYFDALKLVNALKTDLK